MGTETDLNDFIINSVSNKNVSFKDNDSIINESDIINDINFTNVKDVSLNNLEKEICNGVGDGKGVGGNGVGGGKGIGHRKGVGDENYIKNKLKKLIIETQQNAINNNKRKKNMLFTMR
jgi:hypothetical protein